MQIINNVRLYRPQIEDDLSSLYHLIIKDGKIDSINKGLAESNSDEIIDGRGLTLAPSFNDSHMHLLRFGLMKLELDLREVTSWEEMKKVVKDHHNHQEMEEHEWVVGRGMMDEQFTDLDRLLNAADLEELDYKRPVFFLHDDGHECVVNEEAMKLIREKDDLSRFPQEFIETDEYGKWTGRLKDTIIHFIQFHFEQKSKKEAKEAIESAIPHLLENGITSLHTDDLNFVVSFNELWEVYTELEQEGKLPIDVFVHHYIFNIEDLENFLATSSLRTGDGTERVKMGAIKIFTDGTQRLHTAALQKPYTDVPQTRGILNYPPDHLRAIVKKANENNMQVAMHAIGDRSIGEALSAIQKAGDNKMRHRIIHAQVLNEDLLTHMQQVKPYLEIQPGFLMKEYSETRQWVGEEREKYCNAWNTVYQNGIPFTCSSDCPIGPLSPLIEMFAAVNRTDQQGNPTGGWLPEEKLPLDVIYKAYTETPAQLEFQENKKGKLEKGYLADFVLLSDHPKEVADFKIQDLSVEETWSRGERVFINHNK